MAAPHPLILGSEDPDGSGAWSNRAWLVVWPETSELIGEVNPQWRRTHEGPVCGSI